MNRLYNQVRRPVKRQYADDYLLLTLLSFAASVAGTRLFLEITGYPQLGGGGIHIAHVLWGGMLLFAASLLPLILANRWVYPLTALIAGTGVGLFIDEVGKFITSNNDYFFPAAAPIIYAFFLVIVLIYARIRRPPPTDVRLELYHALDALEEVLDHDMEEKELLELRSRLHAVTQQAIHPDLAQLAVGLLQYLEREDIHLVVEIPTFWQRLINRWTALETRYVTEKRIRALIIGGLFGLGINSFYSTVLALTARFTPEIPISAQGTVYWFFARVGLDGVVALMLIVSAIFMLFGQVQRGLSYSYYSLILALTTVNLLVFYFNQFSTIIPALVQFTLLLLVIYYRRHFLNPGDQK